MEFLFEYGLFLAKTVTFLLAIIIVITVVIALGSKNRRPDQGHIDVQNINDRLKNVSRNLRQFILNDEAWKQEAKAEKKRQKQEAKAQKKSANPKNAASAEVARKPRVYVVDFEGDVQASAVSQLREEVTAILSVAEPVDEVVIRLESPGGMVHSYGLAASQLSRIVSKNVKLTVAVDKVAASGGYMMACIADNIIAAPFALLGSIGVVAQIPNFHRFLQGKDIDVEVLTAGEFKRTMTMFGENTEKGREKFMAELEDVHQLFKEYVSENRPIVNTDEVATGEAWYGKRALEHKLVDALQTSDEYLVQRCDEADVFKVKYVEDRNRVDKILDRMSAILMRITGKQDLEYKGPFTF